MSFMKKNIITERFKNTVKDIEIIKNFFPTPDWLASLPATEIDSSFMKINLFRLLYTHFE